MELIFVRHGQGTHTTDLPATLQLSDPPLTNEGIRQAEKLRTLLPLHEDDVLIVSPTRRTLQTADVWSEHINCRKIVHPLLGPRIFPLRPDATTLPCDELVNLKRLNQDFPSFEIKADLQPQLWQDGINLLTDSEFVSLADQFLKYCRTLHHQKVHLVSHDGTITSYRQMINGKNLSRDDFLQETEWIGLTYK